SARGQTPARPRRRGRPPPPARRSPACTATRPARKTFSSTAPAFRQPGPCLPPAGRSYLPRVVERVLRCDCGFEARAEDEAALVAQIQRHASDVHGMTLTWEQALELAFHVELGEVAWPRTRDA